MISKKSAVLNVPPSQSTSDMIHGLNSIQKMLSKKDMPLKISYLVLAIPLLHQSASRSTELAANILLWRMSLLK